MTLPLEGLLILDLADEPLVLAGRLLADLGADVVRVEPVAGDAVRRRGPFVDDLAGVERGLAHILYNAGKRSVALDFERPEAWGLAGALAAHADVIIAPMEPGPLAADFFAEPRLRSIAPTAGVVDAVLRRGSDDRAVSDIAGIAAGGQMYLNGYEEDPPNLPAGHLAFKQASIVAAFAAMSLVLERDRSGAGGRITVSMQEAVMWTTIQSANENYWYWHQQRPKRRGLANLGGQTVFEAADGRWVSFYQHPPYWPNYVEWVDEALGDRRFSSSDWDEGLYRLRHFEAITEATVKLCRTMARDDLVREGQRRSILVVPVQGVADIAEDPHLLARGFFQEVAYPQLGRPIETMRAPFVSTAYRVTPRRAPVLGEHSREVLATVARLGSASIDRLVAEGIVGVAPAGVAK